jgi:hypothetical protein
VATFDPSFYANPRLLWNAQPPVPPAITITIQGNVLTLKRAAGLIGVYAIQVTASDGALTSTQTFWVTLN